MKVLQVNTVYKEKSTGRTCYEVQRALENHGHQGYVAYGRGKHNEENTYRIGTDFEYYVHNLLGKITGLQGYFSYIATKRFIRYINTISPDIIHLRNLHSNYVNLPLLFKYLSRTQIPVVLNLHDCWAFTGKCAHYTDIQCYKWKTECYSCPVVHSYPQSWFFDTTRKLYRDKKRWFARLQKLVVIGVSEWTAAQAKLSFLSKRKITSIYNWVNRDTFYPRMESVLNKHGINPDKFLILGVSAAWTPGSPRYEDFIKLSKEIPDDMQIVLVGKSDGQNFPNNIKHINFVENMDELAQLYSFADVYVHLSTEDTFGKVVAEAMACGTPVVVYRSTGLPELVKEGCGYIVEKRDLRGIVNCLRNIQRNGKSYYSKNCVSNVAENFDYTRNTEKLIEQYESTMLEWNL